MTAQFTHQGTRGRVMETAIPVGIPVGHGRLRATCHRFHLVLQDMSYGARRAVEVQAPWSVDGQWHRR
jgi:hypothetical protein